MMWMCTAETGPTGHFEYRSDIGEKINVYVMQDGIEISVQVNQKEEGPRVTIPFVDMRKENENGGYDTIAVLIGWLRNVHQTRWASPEPEAQESLPF